MRTERVERYFKNEEIKALKKRNERLLKLGLYEVKYVRKLEGITTVRDNPSEVSGYCYDSINDEYVFVRKLFNDITPEEDQKIKEGYTYEIKRPDIVTDKDYELMNKDNPDRVAYFLRLFAFVWYGLSVIPFIVVLVVGGLIVLPAGLTLFLALIAAGSQIFIGLIIHSLSIIVSKIVLIEKKVNEVM